MHVSPSSACLLIFMVSVALAQKSAQTKSDRDNTELRGPVKTVPNEQTFSRPDGQQFLMSTTTEYAPDGRILEQRTKNTDGSEWVVSYTYDAHGRLLRLCPVMRARPRGLKQLTYTTRHEGWSQ